MDQRSPGVVPPGFLAMRQASGNAIVFEPVNDSIYTSWLHLSGVAACYLVVLALLGLALRHYFSDPRAVWEFAACVVLWWSYWMGIDLADEVLETLPFWDEDFPSKIKFAVTLYAHYGLSMLTTVVYVWAVARRHTTQSAVRMGTIMLLTGAVWLIWGLADAFYDAPRQQFHFHVSWQSRMAMSFVDDGAPSWQSAVGWIIWYVGLFGGKRKGTEGVEPLSVTPQETSP